MKTYSIYSYTFQDSLKKNLHYQEMLLLTFRIQKAYEIAPCFEGGGNQVLQRKKRGEAC